MTDAKSQIQESQRTLNRITIRKKNFKALDIATYHIQTQDNRRQKENL